MCARRVLVVDDDRSNSMVVAGILSPLGYTVDVADNGSAALKLLDRNHYDLGVLDYNMPEIDGVELFRRIREQQANVQGILLTAYTTIDKVFPAIDSGIARVLSKPVEAKELVAVVHDLLGTPDSANHLA